MALVGKLVTEITADNSQFISAFNKANSKATEFSRSLSLTSANIENMGKKVLSYGKWIAAGLTAATAGLFYLIDNTAARIDQLTDSARGLGVGAENLQKLTYAASLSGVGFDKLEQGIKKSSLAVGTAIASNTESFKMLGLSLSDLAGMDIDQQYIAIVDGLNKITDANLQAKVASDIFSKGSSDALNLARDGIKANIAEFEKLGLALSDYQRSQVDSFGDSKTKLLGIWNGFSEKVVAYVAPAFTSILDFISKTILDMGGINEAAKSFSSAIIGGVIVAAEAVNGLITAFTTLQKIMIAFDELQTSNKIKDLEKDAAPGFLKLEESDVLKKLRARSQQNAQSIVDIEQSEKSRLSFVGGLKERLEMSRKNMGTELVNFSDAPGNTVSNLSKSILAAAPKQTDVKITVTPSPDFIVKLNVYTDNKINDTIADAARSIGR